LPSSVATGTGGRDAHGTTTPIEEVGRGGTRESAIPASCAVTNRHRGTRNLDARPTFEQFAESAMCSRDLRGHVRMYAWHRHADAPRLSHADRTAIARRGVGRVTPQLDAGPQSRGVRRAGNANLRSDGVLGRRPAERTSARRVVRWRRCRDVQRPVRRGLEHGVRCTKGGRDCQPAKLTVHNRRTRQAR
jgi:hypothetical protein